MTEYDWHKDWKYLWIPREEWPWSNFEKRQSMHLWHVLKTIEMLSDEQIFKLLELFEMDVTSEYDFIRKCIGGIPEEFENLAETAVTIRYLRGNKEAQVALLRNYKVEK